LQKAWIVSGKRSLSLWLPLSTSIQTGSCDRFPGDGECFAFAAQDGLLEVRTLVLGKTVGDFFRTLVRRFNLRFLGRVLAVQVEAGAVQVEETVFNAVGFQSVSGHLGENFGHTALKQLVQAAAERVIVEIFG
jgi:hypothetical protein